MNATNNRVFLFFVIIFFTILLRFALPSHLAGWSVDVQTSAVIDPGVHVIADKFNGNTTLFLFLNDTELESIQNMTLEITDYGKIVFTENVNITIDKDANNDVNLDLNVDIINNTISVNISAISSMNKAARLYLYNLTWITPRIIINNQICPASHCTQVSYTNGTLIFDVDYIGYTSGLNNYSADETLTWASLTKPEGIYYFEPSPVPSTGNYQYSFNITFVNMMGDAGNIIGCYINESDCYDTQLGSCTQIFVNATLASSATRESKAITYTLKSTDKINTTLGGTTDNWIPWQIIKCGIYESDMTPISEENVTWRIHVHPTDWTTGDIANSVNGKTAANMFLKNTIKTDNQGDISFSVAKYGGTKVEQECGDGVDNPDESDTLSDCSDPECFGITYSCLAKQSFTNASDMYSPSGSHGTLALNIPSGDIAENVTSSTTFTTYIDYTMHSMPNGTFKIRFYKWGLSKTATFFVQGLPTIKTVNKYGPATNASHGLITYFLDKDGNPVLGNSLTQSQANSTRVAVRSYLSGGTEIDNLDTTLNITFADPINISMSEGYILTITVNYVEGTTTYEESLNITTYFDDPTYLGGAGNRWNSTNEKENDIKVGGTSWSPCSDSINGDFDYLNCAGNEQNCFTQSSYDCYDLDCNNEAGPSAWNDFTSTSTSGTCAYYNEAQTTAMCFDSYNNDWATEDSTSGNQNTGLTLVDCRDSDCDTTSNGTATCELNQELTCNDNFNNDMYNLKDCQQQVGSSYNDAEYDCATYCRTNTGNSTETASQCNDNMDNDWDLWQYSTGGASGYTYNANGGMDCAWTTNYPDSDCNLTTMGNGKRCELTHELTCNDNYDNDYDTSHNEPDPNWTESAYEAYFTTLSYTTDTDYDDYDCQHATLVPKNESYTSVACFDSIDNDLDAYYWNNGNWSTNSSTGKDCKDSSCLGINNPSNINQTCLAKEYDSTDSFFNTSTPDLYCENSFDDDADSATDCYDTDCNKKFNLCYACPTTENVTWSACADGNDNDYADGIDCADSDCLGYQMDYNSHICVASGNENTAFFCADKADNDNDGYTDCADSNCIGTNSCQSNETTCNDDIDNDNDGYTDCEDSNCYSNINCNIDSDMSGTYYGPTTSTSTFGSVQVTWDSRVRKGENYTINIYKSSSYSTANLYIGRLTGSALPTTGELTSASFGITGTDAADFETSQYNTAGSKGQIEVLDQVPGTAQPGFDINVEIPTTDTLSSTSFEYYHSIDGSTSTGNTIGVIVLDSTKPTIDDVITEPTNKDSLEYAGTIWVGVKAADANNGKFNEGTIDTCYYNVTGPNNYLASGEDSTDCKFSFTNLTRDGTYTLNVWARDDTGNLAVTDSSAHIVDLKPKYIADSFTLSSNRWYTSSNSITISAKFDTDDASSISNCNVYYKNSQGTITSPGTISASRLGDRLTCAGSISAPSADEMYELWVNITDSESDQAKADSETFYVCNSAASAGVGINGERWGCDIRDMDNNGILATCQATTEVSAVVPVTSTTATYPSGSSYRDEFSPISLSLSATSIFITIRQGETSEQILTLKNSGSKALTIDLLTSGLDKYFTLSETSFTLLPGQSKEIIITFDVSPLTPSKIYKGELSLTANNINKKIAISMDVKEKSLFELTARLPQLVYIGDKLLADIYIINLGDKHPVTAIARYKIMDNEGNIITLQEEILQIDNAYQINKQFYIPERFLQGDYEFIFELETDYSISTTTHPFIISAESPLLVPTLQVPLPLADWQLLYLIIITITGVITYAHLRKEYEKEALGKPLNKNKSIISRYKRGKR
ncbi:MAG: hypothetical protein WC471_05835 [Candidatus Woesearchaeota archaeon]